MKNNKITYITILIGITVLATIFHLLILVKVIPYEITWGGRLKSVEEMYFFETISILINSFFIFILLQKGEYIRYFLRKKTVNIVLWIFSTIFVLNTIGNVFAKTNFEKYFAISFYNISIDEKILYPYVVLYVKSSNYFLRKSLSKSKKSHFFRVTFQNFALFS
jgi:membrane-associated phospholipid phosphatase